ncbi:MAG TPA: CcdB family protein [Kiloniellaceae bacterium]
MARFDIFEYPETRGYLLDIQCDYLSRLSTRIVVPLQPEEDAPPPARDLNPVFRIAGTRYVMMTQYMAAVSESELKKRAGSLAEEQDRVVKALDMIFSGF